MDDLELLNKIKENMKLVDDLTDLIILDMIQEVKSYCNLNELSMEHEPFLRKKVKTIFDYEKEYGDSSVFDIKSLKEGDVSITYSDESSKESIYGLSSSDKKFLNRFRKVRR